MARPRKDSTEPSARERILCAFWELLNEMPYASITVAALIKRAKVSPNTLYYHFGSYRDVVRAALDETLDPGLLPILVAESGSSTIGLAADASERLCKIVLFASDDSGELPVLLRDALLQTWLQELGLSRESLSAIEEAELNFIFAGVVAVLSKRPTVELAESKALLQAFSDRPLGSGILKTLDLLRG